MTLISNRFHLLIKKHLKRVKRILEKESQQSSSMFKVYFLYSQGLASKEQMTKANLQFKSLMKTMGLSFLVILPLAPLTIPAIITLGKKYGVDMIPESFKEEEDEISKPF